MGAMKQYTITLEVVGDFTDRLADLVWEHFESPQADPRYVTTLFGSRSGTPFLDVVRDDDSLEEAILASLRDVAKAGIPVTRVVLDPDDFVAAVSSN